MFYPETHLGDNWFLDFLEAIGLRKAFLLDQTKEKRYYERSGKTFLKKFLRDSLCEARKDEE